MATIKGTDLNSFEYGTDPTDRDYATGEMGGVLDEVEFKKTHWGNFRNTSTRKLASLVQDQPGQVIVFDDPKLADVDSEMVMLEKGLFERMYDGLKQLLDGQMAISTEVKLLKHMVAQNLRLANEGVSRESLQHSLKITSMHAQSVSSVLIPNQHLKSPEPDELSPEDLAWANSAEIDDETRDGRCEE